MFDMMVKTKINIKGPGSNMILNNLEQNNLNECIYVFFLHEKTTFTQHVSGEVV